MKVLIGLLFLLSFALGVATAAGVAFVQHQDQRITNIENYLAAVSAAGR